MLVLKRKEGQWVEIRHRSGDVLRFRVYNIRSRFPGQLDLAFEDKVRNFTIRRPEQPVVDFGPDGLRDECGEDAGI